MSNVQSYNALIDRFKAFASGHFILKTFSHGQIDTADLEKFTEYPFMHVVPSNVTYAKGTKTFSFQIVLADLPRDKDDKVEFQREVLSDLQRIAEDLVAEITNHRVLFGDLITVQNVSLEPFLEEFHNTLTGWTVSLELLVPYYWDACSIPAEWNDFFESSTGGTGSILTFIDSITRDNNGNVSLVNDEAEPSPNYYYGTDDEGVRGWYLLTDEVGLTCETIGDCQTIIDIEAAIDALEEEIVLKADITSISAVGFSNNYNDLDNLPTIPAAQVNSDWNATSGVAEILNKPTLPATVGDMLKSVYDTDVDGVVDSAERIQIVVRNSTGSTLTKGQIVYLSGATGNRPNAVLAQANTEATSSKTIGMVIANISNNADGQVAVNGSLHDLDTSAFTAGDTLWLSATTAGGMVANTPPIEPNHAVFIGYVARSHPNQGRVVLAIQNGYELDELHGVLITSPANNNVLTYESSTSLWKNKTVETALGYTPFNLPSLTSGSVLFSNGTTIAQDNANLFFDDTNNRLGIGTASPVSRLHVGGAVGTLATGLTFGSGVSGIYLLDNTTMNISINSANRFWFRSTDFYPDVNIGIDLGLTSRRWKTLNTQQITDNGTNVLIGTTTDAGFKLDVNGTARFGTNFIWDNTNSRLGIGTASPTKGLTIKANANDDGILLQSSTGGTLFQVTRDGASNNTAEMFLYAGGAIRLAIRSTANFSYFNGGNFGIGTTTDVTSAILNVSSTTKGFLPPRMTNAQRLAIATPAVGLIVYCTDVVEGLYINKSTGWTFVI